MERLAKLYTATGFTDPQSAINGLVEAWLPQLPQLQQLAESNEILTAALKKVRDGYLLGSPPLIAEVLREVLLALDSASRAQRGVHPTCPPLRSALLAKTA